MHPLTKTTEVLAELAAGGRIIAGDRPGLLMLVDSGGSVVPAWQTALKAATKQFGQAVQAVQVNIRMPKLLKQQLEEAAGESKRSLTAEIIHRLENSLADAVATTSVIECPGLPPVALAPARAGRTYIAGPMTGLPDFNHPAFNAAAAALRAQGRTVINPADHGLVADAAWADYVRADLALLASCETIYLLPGWSRSRGAMLEHHVARALGMPVEFADGAETQAEGQQRVEGQMQALIDAIPKRGSDALQPAADPEDVRIARIIASKIDEGRLDHPGFYKNGRLSEALRNILALIDAQANNLNEQLGISEELPPAIDLEQFREAVTYFRDAYAASSLGPDSWQSAKAAEADRLLALIDGQASRSDEQIVEQTEELARLLLTSFYGREVPAGWKFHESEDPISRHVWQAACRVQELLTDTDPENAVSELGGEQPTNGEGE